MMHFYKVTRTVPASFPPLLSPPRLLYWLSLKDKTNLPISPPQLQSRTHLSDFRFHFQPTQCEVKQDEDFRDNPFPHNE